MSYIASTSAPARRARVAPSSTLGRFLAVGVVGLVVDLGLLWVLERAGLPMAGARAISLPVATLATWLLNRRHTFGASGRAAHHEALRYAAVSAVAQSVNYVVGLVAAATAMHVPALVAAAPTHLLHLAAAFCGSVVATLFSYTGHKLFTFSGADRPSRV